MRVAVNVEQLLYRTPGGIGRYTAQLVTLLPRLLPEDDVVPFTARHPAAHGRAGLPRPGVDPTPRRRHASCCRCPVRCSTTPGLAGPAPAAGAACRRLIHAPSVAVPPRGCPAGRHRPRCAPALSPRPSRPGAGVSTAGHPAAARRADLVITGSQAAADEMAATPPSRPIGSGWCPTAWTPMPSTRRARRGRPRPAGPRRAAVRALGRQPRAAQERRDPGGGHRPAAAPEPRRRLVRDVQLVLAGPGMARRPDLLSAADGPPSAPAASARARSTMRSCGRCTRARRVRLSKPARGLRAAGARGDGPGHRGGGADIPALREVAGGAARLVPPDDVDGWADALEELLADEPARRRLAAAGRERARGFAVTRAITGLRAVYRGGAGR